MITAVPSALPVGSTWASWSREWEGGLGSVKEEEQGGRQLADTGERNGRG